MGLKALLTDLESFDANNNSMDSYGFHDTPESSGGFNYGQSISIFDFSSKADVLIYFYNALIILYYNLIFYL